MARNLDLAAIQERNNDRGGAFPQGLSDAEASCYIDIAFLLEHISRLEAVVRVAERVGRLEREDTGLDDALAALNQGDASGN